MKKSFIILLLICSISVLLISLCACGEEENKECDHNWVGERTCTEGRKCSICGEEQPPFQHSLTNPTDPTIPVKCVNCDYVGSAVLNEYESLIYRSIIHEMSDFKDPASVELMDVWEGEANYYGETEMFYYLTISAKNSFGGRVKENYYIRKDAYYYDQLMVAPSYYRKQTAFEVNDFLINSQIQKYIQQQGWE